MNLSADVVGNEPHDALAVGCGEALGRRLARGQTLAQEISQDIEPSQTAPATSPE